MSVSVTGVRTRSELKEWALLPFRFYRDDPRYVPQIIREEADFFSADRNPGSRITDTKLLLALQNGKSVGRVCGIVHRLEEKMLGCKRGRFGWFECIDDAESAAALFGRLEDWFAESGCLEITGPHGFSDLDPEGLLIDGFDVLPTIAGAYNKPYYRRLLEGLGFEKEVDYIEQRIEFPADEPRFP